MRHIRLYVKEKLRMLGLDNFATEMWFKYLGFKNALSISFLAKNISLEKRNRKILITRGQNQFGSTGIVVRDFDDFFNTIVGIKDTDGREVIDFSIPQYHTLKRGNEKFFFHDICEPTTVTDIYVEKSKLKKGDVVLDIGGYCGTQTVYFSRLVGSTGMVLTFEPDVTSFASLKKNLDNHKCDNTKACNFGVFSFDGEIGFSSTGSMGAAVSVDLTDKIEVKRLDSICKMFNLNKIDFIKMDIEGAEIDVLKSSVDVINQFKPRFIIEPHFNKAGILNDKEIISIFKNINYDIEILKQGAFDYQPLIYAYPK